MRCLTKDILKHIKDTAQEAQKAVQETDKTMDHNSMEYFLSRVPAMTKNASEVNRMMN